MYYHFNEANGALENIYTLEEALAHGVMSEEARFQTAALEVYGQLISAQQAVGLTGIPLNFATVTNKDALMGFAMLGRETLVAMGFSPESVEQLIGINVNQLAQMQADALIDLRLTGQDVCHSDPWFCLPVNCWTDEGACEGGGVR